MIRIHFVTGNKGNVGKSLWASGLIEYYRSHGKKLIFIDGDKDSKTLRSTYKESLIIMLSDDPIMADQPDMILDLAQEQLKPENAADIADILIDLPAGGEKSINNWIKDCALDKSADLADTLPVTLFKWWVCDSDMDSISLFEKSVAAYPDIKHIFLKNMGCSRQVQWISAAENTNLTSLKDTKKIKIIEIPVLASDTINFLRAKKLELGPARFDESVPLTKQLRVKAWLSKTGQAIDRQVLLSKEKAQVETPESDKADSKKAQVKKQEPDKADSKKALVDSKK